MPQEPNPTPTLAVTRIRADVEGDAPAWTQATSDVAARATARETELSRGASFSVRVDVRAGARRSGDPNERAPAGLHRRRAVRRAPGTGAPWQGPLARPLRRAERDQLDRADHADRPLSGARDAADDRLDLDPPAEALAGRSRARSTRDDGRSALLEVTSAGRSAIDSTRSRSSGGCSTRLEEALGARRESIVDGLSNSRRC